MEERNQVLTYFQLLGKVESPMVSMVVPVFRAKETLMAHIFSLMHLKTIVPYEVIFVDNNADEASLAILREVGAHIVKEERQGITYARQKGLESARGEVVCSLDPDTIYEPWYIDKMAIPFFVDTELVLCYSISQSYKDDFKLPKKMQLRNWLKKVYFKWKLSQDILTQMKFIRAACLAVRKEAFLPLGYRTDLRVVSGCDDGIAAMELYTQGKFKYVSASVYTALPPPREAGKSFPFCNERFMALPI